MHILCVIRGEGALFLDGRLARKTVRVSLKTPRWLRQKCHKHLSLEKCLHAIPVSPFVVGIVIHRFHRSLTLQINNEACSFRWGMGGLTAKECGMPASTYTRGCTPRCLYGHFRVDRMSKVMRTDTPSAGERVQSFPKNVSHYCTRVQRVNSCAASHWLSVNQ